MVDEKLRSEDDENEALFREIVRWDWLYAGRHNVLHAPLTYEVPPGEWYADNVEFACGYTVEYASIPGMFSRMGMKRCSRCCDRTGLPRGIGSPKNDEACRLILELPIGEEAHASVEAS